MGILVRQEDKEWIVGLKEAWVFDLDSLKGFLDFVKSFKDVVFVLSVVGEGSQTFRVTFTSAKFRCGSFDACKVVLDRLLYFKEKFGQLSEHRRFRCEGERY